MQTDAILAKIDELVAVCREHGAWIHEDIRFQVINDGISVHKAQPSPAREIVISVPIALMPAINQIDLQLEGDSILFRQSTSLSDLHKTIVSLLVEIYNLSDKIKNWRNDYFYLALAPFPAIRDRIIEFKPSSIQSKGLDALANRSATDQFVVNSFIGSRAFQLRPGTLKSINLENTPAQRVLLPIIDFMNHKVTASGFGIDEGSDIGPVMTISANASEAGEELFVRYNAFDPVDTYLFYGFVDESAPWLASAPITLTLPDGRQLKVLNSGARRKKAPPKAFADLRAFLPQVTRSADGSVVVSRLYIPSGNAPRALRRVLSFLVRGVQAAQNRRDLNQAVVALERQVIDANVRWWQETRALIDAAGEHPQLAACTRLCEFSQQFLENYKKSNSMT